MSTKSSTPDDEDAVVAIAKRKAVLSVVTDGSLSAVERNAKIRDIMDFENYHHRSVPLPQKMMANKGVDGKGTSTTAAPGGGAFGITFSARDSEYPYATNMEGGDDSRKPATTNATASPASSDNFEERIAAKMRGESYKKSASANTPAAPTSYDSFEERIATKMNGGEIIRQLATTNTTTATAASDSFDERIAAKMGGESYMKSATANTPAAPTSSDSFEERIAAKMNGGEIIRQLATTNTTAATAASDSFDERIAAKMGGESYKKSATANTPVAPAASDSFEDRIAAKMKGGDNRKSATASTAAASAASDSFEHRISAKMKGGDSYRKSSTDGTAAAPAASDSFDEGSAIKMKGVDENSSVSTRIMGSANIARAPNFEERPVATINGADNDANVHSAPSVDAGGPAGGEGILRDMPDEDDIALAKRAAIRSVMKDLTLSSKERQEKIPEIVSGKAMLPMTAAPTLTGGDSFDEKIAAVTKGGDINAASSVDRDCTEEQIAVKMREDGSNAASLGDRRNCFVAQHTADKKESDMNRSMGDVPNLSSSSRRRREDIDAKIARKLSRMRPVDGIGSDDDDDVIRSGDDDDVGFGSFLSPEDHVSYNNNSGRNDHDDDDSVVDGGFVGVGSLPLPEEHFVDNTEYPQQQHSDDITFGLAVATAIDPDEEEAYIYNAIEYDPDAKPPLHKNRRFRVYSYLALLLITSECYDYYLQVNPRLGLPSWYTNASPHIIT